MSASNLVQPGERQTFGNKLSIVEQLYFVDAIKKLDEFTCRFYMGRCGDTFKATLAAPPNEFSAILHITRMNLPGCPPQLIRESEDWLRSRGRDAPLVIKHES